MLTPKQIKVYDFVKEYLENHDYAPTLVEIAEGLGYSAKSKGTIHTHLKMLEKAGYVSLQGHGNWRNIRLLDREKSPDKHVPVLGKIAAGSPIEAIVDVEHVDLGSLAGPNRFALKVSGNSMIDDGIHEGDYVICEKCEDAPDGSIVVALIDKANATLKRIEKQADTIHLHPANANYETQSYAAHQVTVQGTFVGLVRF